MGRGHFNQHQQRFQCIPVTQIGMVVRGLRNGSGCENVPLHTSVLTHWRFAIRRNGDARRYILWLLDPQVMVWEPMVVVVQSTLLAFLPVGLPLRPAFGQLGAQGTQVAHGSLFRRLQHDLVHLWQVLGAHVGSRQR